MKKILAILLCCAALLAGCGQQMPDKTDDGRLKIVATVFPAYDFARSAASGFADVELLLPDEEEQQAVMALIYDGVKAGKADFDARPVQKIAQRLLERGAQSIILGCTELPLAMSMYQLDFPATNPTLELAKGAVAFARGLEG